MSATVASRLVSVVSSITSYFMYMVGVSSNVSMYFLEQCLVPKDQCNSISVSINFSYIKAGISKCQQKY